MTWLVDVSHEPESEIVDHKGRLWVNWDGSRISAVDDEGNEVASMQVLATPDRWGLQPFVGDLDQLSFRLGPGHDPDTGQTVHWVVSMHQ